MRVLATIVLLWAAICAAPAQSSPRKSASTPKPATSKAASTASRSECAIAAGFCVTVPASWQRFGNIFGDLGFVVAEPHPGVDSSKWPQLSVAAIDVPPQKDGDEQRTLDSIVDMLLTPDDTFTSAETQQRTRLVLNGANAEIIRVKLHDEASNTDAIEEVALIEGAPAFVYAVALRCAPEDFSRLEPVFQKAAHSWRIKADDGAPTPPSNPKQDPVKK